MDLIYDARDVANFLLDAADGSGIALTQISLQKTVFYSHGWYLVLKDRPLISNEVEGWRYGPVIRVLRDSFRKFGRRGITERAQFYDPIEDKTFYRPYVIAERDQDFLRQMLSFYSKIDPFMLVAMTHKEGSPWEQIIASGEANLGRVINNEIIHSYFANLLTNRGKI